MTQSLLFDRKISVTVGPKGQTGLQVNDFRVKFKVEQSSEPQANKARVEIFNLSKDSRFSVERPGNYLILRAGYAQTIARIFEGDIPAGGVLTEKTGPDFITVFECGDGQKKLQETMMNNAFKPGVKAGDVFQTVIDSFGFDKGTVSGVNENQTFLQGLTLAGSAKDVMNHLTGKQNLVWNVQDGVLHIYPRGGSVGGAAILLSSTTGLIESPKRGDKKIEVKCLLQPSIRPGKLIKLDSDFLKGIFVVDKCIHEGDNYDRSFFTTIEISLEEKK